MTLTDTRATFYWVPGVGRVCGMRTPLTPAGSEPRLRLREAYPAYARDVSPV